MIDSPPATPQAVLQEIQGPNAEEVSRRRQLIAAEAILPEDEDVED